MLNSLSPLQISLAALFGLTSVIAVAVVLFQSLGLFWILMIGSVFVFWRVPTREGANPLLLGIGYAAVAMAIPFAAAYMMRVSANEALVSCFVLPALAYLLGFYKGMENA